MKTISFKTSAEDSAIINKIVDRALRVAGVHGIDYDRMSAEMDLRACHANGCALDLQKLLDAPASDFGHDIFGIRRYIDRETGELRDCFLPRTAKA